MVLPNAIDHDAGGKWIRGARDPVCECGTGGFVRRDLTAHRFETGRFYYVSFPLTPALSCRAREKLIAVFRPDVGAYVIDQLRCSETQDFREVGLHFVAGVVVVA